jgi:hypothetical protein
MRITTNEQETVSRENKSVRDEQLEVVFTGLECKIFLLFMRPHVEKDPIKQTNKQTNKRGEGYCSTMSDSVNNPTSVILVEGYEGVP